MEDHGVVSKLLKERLFKHHDKLKESQASKCSDTIRYFTADNN